MDTNTVYETGLTEVRSSFLVDSMDEGFAALAIAIFRSIDCADDAFDCLSGLVPGIKKVPYGDEIKAEDILKYKKDHNLTWEEVGLHYGRTGGAIKKMVARRINK